MNDQRDIPLPSEQLNFKVQVFAIFDYNKKQYEELSTGTIQLTTDEDQDQIINFLQVKNQTTKEVLMRSRIRLTNNYGTQKGTIISWTDPDQINSQEIAISFQKQEECEIYWRMICQKIGKNYLQINGQEKLQMPNQNNLQHILEKAKNSADMVNYNIQHSEDFLNALTKTYATLRKNNDQMGMGTVLRIVKCLMSTYNIKIIESFLRGEHFFLLLDLQSFKHNIKFKQIYEQSVGKYLNNKFLIPRQVYDKIQISHRAIFYRQNAINLAEQGALQSSMLMVSKQVSVDIISYLNKGSILQKIINCSDYEQLKQLKEQSTTSKQQIQEIKPVLSQNNIQLEQKLNNLKVQDLTQKEQLVNDKVTFVLQAFAIYKHVTSENMKIRFLQKVYSSGILEFVKTILNTGNYKPSYESQKSIQILIYACQADRQKFFAYLIDSFKNNSTDNLLRVLTKKYAASGSLREEIIVLIQGFIPIMNEKVEHLQFFNGTFLCLVFGTSKDFEGILLLILSLMCNLVNTSALYSYIIKSKVLEKLSTEYRSGSGMKTKRQELLIVKILKSILIEQSRQRTKKTEQMIKTIVESGYFDICMIVYMKHSLKYNIISSSMLQNFKLIQKMQYSLIDQHLIKQYLANNQLEKLLQPIKLKYIDHQNQIDKNKMFQGVRNANRKVHDETLENEMEDSYLMGGDSDSSSEQQKLQKNNQNVKSQEKGQEQEKIKIKKEREQAQLEQMKRMRDQLSNRNEQEMTQTIRKQVKRSQDSKQTAILSFDLPEWDQQQQLQNEQSAKS